MSIRCAQVGAVIVLALASLVACSTGSASTVAAPESSESNIGPLTSSLVDTSSASSAVVHWPQLAGGTYRSTSVTGFHLQPGTVVTIGFDHSGRLTAQAGCNNLNATATVTGGRLSSGPLSQTAMACKAAKMTQDAWLSDVLTSGPTLSVRGNQLVLASGTTVITLQRKLVKAQSTAVTTTSVTVSAAGTAVSTATLSANADGLHPPPASATFGTLPPSGSAATISSSQVSSDGTITHGGLTLKVPAEWMHGSYQTPCGDPTTDFAIIATHSKGPQPACAIVGPAIHGIYVADQDDASSWLDTSAATMPTELTNGLPALKGTDSKGNTVVSIPSHRIYFSIQADPDVTSRILNSVKSVR